MYPRNCTGTPTGKSTHERSVIESPCSVEFLEPRRMLAAGDLDFTFGYQGKQISDLPLAPTDLAVQADGKLLVSGYGLGDVGHVFRLNANGSPDNSFGIHQNSLAASGVGYYSSIANAVATGPNGLIAVAGFAGPFRNEIPNQATLVLYDSSGLLVKTFGGDGVLELPQFPRGFTDVAFQADGKILALGEKLARFNPDGTLDKTFDGDGIADVSGRKLTIDANGRIVVLGYFALFRYNATGARDNTFDGDGVVPNVKALDVAIAPDGDILVAGNGDARNLVTRFNANGAIDKSFGSNGNAAVFGHTLAITSSNIFVGGTAPDLVIPHDQFLISALTHAGQYDTTFGPNTTGQTKTDFTMNNDRVVALGIQTGRLIALGSAQVNVDPAPSTELHAALARYQIAGATPPPAGQTPWTGFPLTLPDTIALVNFDKGGEAVAYHDIEAANLGGAYRPNEGPDIQSLPGVNHYALAFVKPGEWVEYTVNLPTSGNFDLSFAAGHLRKGGTFHLEIDGQNITGSLRVPTTGDWTKFSTLAGPNLNVNIAAGNHVLRLVFDTAGDLGYVGNFTFLFVQPGYLQTPFKGTPFSPAQRIEAEDFDLGGEGIAYHDTNSSNIGGAYRQDVGVDIEPTADAGGGFNVGFLGPGEWLEYAVNFPEAGNYDLQFSYAKLLAGGSFRMTIGGLVIGGDLGRSTGSWQTYATRTISSLPIPFGQQTLRFEVVSADNTGYALNLNWFQFNKV